MGITITNKVISDAYRNDQNNNPGDPCNPPRKEIIFRRNDPVLLFHRMIIPFVPGVGVEPTCPFEQLILSQSCLTSCSTRAYDASIIYHQIRIK